MTVAATAPSTNGASASSTLSASPCPRAPPDGEHRAAQVGQHDHAGPALGLADPACHLRRAGPEPAVFGAAGRDNGDRAAADLGGEVGRTFGELGAVRQRTIPTVPVLMGWAVMLC